MGYIGPTHLKGYNYFGFACNDINTHRGLLCSTQSIFRWYQEIWKIMWKYFFTNWLWYIYLYEYGKLKLILRYFLFVYESAHFLYNNFSRAFISSREKLRHVIETVIYDSWYFSCVLLTHRNAVAAARRSKQHIIFSFIFVNL